MELDESSSLTSDDPTKLQLSKQYGTSKKTEIQYRKPRNNSCTYGQSMTNKARLHNAGKIVSSTNSAGNTGQLHAKK